VPSEALPDQASERSSLQRPSGLAVQSVSSEHSMFTPASLTALPTGLAADREHAVAVGRLGGGGPPFDDASASTPLSLGGELLSPFLPPSPFEEEGGVPVIASSLHALISTSARMHAEGQVMMAAVLKRMGRLNLAPCPCKPNSSAVASGRGVTFAKLSPSSLGASSVASLSRDERARRGWRRTASSPRRRSPACMSTPGGTDG
jgi:hypothetical protein